MRTPATSPRNSVWPRRLTNWIAKRRCLSCLTARTINYGPQQWLHLFVRTDAALATAMSMLPLEPLLDDLPHNFGYLYSELPG